MADAAIAIADAAIADEVFAEGTVADAVIADAAIARIPRLILEADGLPSPRLRLVCTALTPACATTAATCRCADSGVNQV
jgi:hypothetical protein